MEWASPPHSAFIHSAFILANLIAFAYFSVSSAMSLPRVGGGAREAGGADVCEPRFQLGIGQPRVDLGVEPVDDFGGRVPYGNATRTNLTPFKLYECSGQLASESALARLAIAQSRTAFTAP
jgi:hypothetical protein